MYMRLLLTGRRVHAVVRLPRARLQLPEHLDVPTLEAVPLIEPEDAVDVFGRRIQHRIRDPPLFSLSKKLSDQAAPDAPPSELRRDVKIVNLKVAFAFRYNRHAGTDPSRTRDEADNLIANFCYEEVRTNGSFNLLPALRHEPINTTFFKPLLLKSGDGLSIRSLGLPNECLIHIKIIAGTSSCAAA